MDALTELVLRHGGVIDLRSIDDAGIPRAAVAAHVRAGSLRRIRRGWFAAHGAPPVVVRAVSVGGALTAASAAKLAGLWVLGDPRLHVRVARTASRLGAPHDRRVPLNPRHGVCVHYSRDRPVGACDPPPRAIAEMFHCAGLAAAMVSLESALNSRRLLPEALPDIRARVPAAHRATFDTADAGAQSGLETLVRLLLRRHRIRFRTQVWIEPAGRVDILVGDRLVLELDGERFHTGTAFEEDRRRDLHLVLQGYIVVRFTYRMVTSHWDQVEASILSLVRRDEHLWKSRHTSMRRFTAG